MRKAMRRSIPSCVAVAALSLLAAAAQVAAGVPGSVRAAAVRDAKRGVASSRYLGADPSKLARLGAAWAYDWSAAAPPATPGLMWVPMAWSPASLTAANVA